MQRLRCGVSKSSGPRPNRLESNSFTSGARKPSALRKESSVSAARKRVAVVGTGTMGSQAAWRLAARGAEVVGYDRFAPGHDRSAAG
ncbi:NAD(P)-dependent oxidoreductase, partial [Streptomyces yerevanensis]|uniref:NAD(P)-dependent oxidoreductase n=1 Tax=Streptomyces yerevanensis TaxID=66378 RepID=UPI0024806966